MREIDAVDEVDFGRQGFEQPRHLPRVVLGIAVGVEDELLRRLLEARAQGTPVAAVGAVVHDLQPREVTRHLVEQLARVVGAAVVDDDDLVVIGELARGHVRNQGEAGDGPRVVVGGEEDGEARAHHWKRRP